MSHTASPCVGSFVQCRYIHREPLYIVHCIVNSDCPRLICVLVRPATYKERCRSSARVQELRKDGSYAEQPQRCQHGESARRMIAQGGNQPCGENHTTHAAARESNDSLGVDDVKRRGILAGICRRRTSRRPRHRPQVPSHVRKNSAS